MGLMFPRLARNFAKNGYYPTDEATLERALGALQPSAGTMRIIDPCAGEGVAIAEAAYVLGRDSVQAYAVEYDRERASHAREMADQVLQGDLFDTMISRQSFGLLWFNPPYGDLVADHSGASQYQSKGRRRLEKVFYQRAIHFLQYGGVMVCIVPNSCLDVEFSSWLCNHFSDLQVYRAPDQQFRQIVVFGVRTKRKDQDRTVPHGELKDLLLAIGKGDSQPDELPIEWTLEPYQVPATTGELEHFYRVSLEASQFAEETSRLSGLWPDFGLHFHHMGAQPRPPVRALSSWHLALALAAGAISGVVTSKAGKVLVLKGDTYKEKSRKTEFTENEDGTVSEVRILTDRFIPMILAWDMTPGSASLGRIMKITSTAKAEEPPPIETPETAMQDVRASVAGSKFPSGSLVFSRGVNDVVADGFLNPAPYIRRHFAGDWGDCCDEDKRSNDAALRLGNRLFSVYDIDVEAETKLWIITEADRSVTTLLFPSEY
ncbi:DUF6094 domain-containing protein [Pseudomonas caricapapayae]|nr:DUF6094 domain-containing protein [Pseudomonas caricapapayae]